MKGFKLALLLTVFMVFLFAGSGLAVAATLSMKADGNSNNTYGKSDIASELLGQAYDVYNGGSGNGADAPLVAYSAISFSANDIITFKLSNAKFNNTVKLCVNDGLNNNTEGADLISTTPTSSAPQDTVTFRINANGAGKSTFILARSCAASNNGTDYDAIPLLVNAGLTKGAKIEISVPEAYIAGTTITLSGALASATTILKVEDENTVTVTPDTTAIIDFDADMKKFKSETTGDTTTTASKPSLKRTYTPASITAGDLGASDSVKVTIEGDMSGIKEIYWDLNDNGTKNSGEAFTIDTANNKATITVAGSNPGVGNGAQRKVYIVVDETTPLNARTLKVTYQIDFSSASKVDRILASAEDFSKFVLNAYQALVPFVKSTTGYETYIKFTSSYKPATGATTANKVKAAVTCIDGTSKVEEITQLTTGVVGAVTGAGLLSKFGSTCVNGEGFAVTFTVNAPQNNVATYAVTTTPTGEQRRIPVKDTNTLSE